VTRGLFVTGDRDFAEGARRVRLTIPKGWEIAAPWPQSGDDPHAFRATSWLDLINNSFVIGRFQRSVAREGGFTLSFALLPSIARDIPSLDRTTLAILREYLSLFPRTRPDRYLMTFFYADHDDGEAWNRSAALTFAHRVSDADALLFHNTIAHELMHHWLGAGLLRSTDHDLEQWLTEGFTEYYANRAIYREGLITARDYLEKLSRHVGAYAYFWWSPVFGHVTLREAGSDKTRYRFGVYDGGAVTALCLDLRIRQLTQDRRSLDDVMRLLFDRFALSGKTFSYEDVVAAMVEVGGEDLRSFLARYVTGHEQLPYREMLEGVGVHVLDWPLAAEAYLSQIPEASLSRDQAEHRPRLLALAAAAR
jgi:predicted metalloprotease with PDZ domain